MWHRAGLFLPSVVQPSADTINLLSAGVTIKTGSRTLKNKRRPGWERRRRRGRGRGSGPAPPFRGAKWSNCSHRGGFMAAVVVVFGCSGSPFLLLSPAPAGAVVARRGWPASDGTGPPLTGPALMETPSERREGRGPPPYLRVLR